MAGHSQFKNIMHKKGKQDAIRSKLFSKLAREITVAAKLGLPDPAMNARLRAAIIAARAENMPKDNIERAIKKAAGAEGENYDEVRYEGYAPGGVAVIVEALTDNRNRTAGEVRSYFTKSGGSLAETGAVSFMFDRVGLDRLRPQGRDDDAMLEAAIDAGADDVVSGPDEHEIITTIEALRDAQKALEAKFGEPTKAAIVWRPQTTIAVDDEAGEKILRLIDALEDNDDVQNVYRELRDFRRADGEDGSLAPRFHAALIRGSLAVRPSCSDDPTRSTSSAGRRQSPSADHTPSPNDASRHANPIRDAIRRASRHATRPAGCRPPRPAVRATARRG